MQYLLTRDCCGQFVLMFSESPSIQTDLHLVYVGGVVSQAAVRGDGLTAAVRHHPPLRLRRGYIRAVHPVVGVVATTALELEDVKKGKHLVLLCHVSQWKFSCLGKS